MGGNVVTKVIDLNADMDFFRFNEPVIVSGSEGVDAWFVGYEIDEAGARTGRANVTFSEKHPRKCIPVDLAKITHKVKKPVVYKPKPEVVIEEKRQLELRFE